MMNDETEAEARLNLPGMSTRELAAIFRTFGKPKEQKCDANTHPVHEGISSGITGQNESCEPINKLDVPNADSGQSGNVSESEGTTPQGERPIKIHHFIPPVEARAVAPVETPQSFASTNGESTKGAASGMAPCHDPDTKAASVSTVETRLTAEQFYEEHYDQFLVVGVGSDRHKRVYRFAEAFRDKSEAAQKSKLQWLLANLCAKHADINTCSSGPCAMCEAAGLREEIERLKEGERLLRDFLERDYGVSEITTICSRYDDAEQELTELRAKLTEQGKEIAGLRHRVHHLEAHNQYFFRCESAWCNPAEDSNPALESFKQNLELRVAAEAEAAARREREREKK